MTHQIYETKNKSNVLFLENCSFSRELRIQVYCPTGRIENIATVIIITLSIIEL